MSGDSGGPGLRERKKARTREVLSETAVRLFLEKGYDRVSVAEVAEAAGVSKPTVFRYFGSKEDLVLYRFADHEDEAARVVAARGAGESPVAALRRNFLAGIERRDPVTGVCDHPAVLAYLRLLYGTPALVARMAGYQERSERVLAGALEAAGWDPVGASLAAGQVVAVQRILAQENVRRVVDGEAVQDVAAYAVAAAERGFGQLEGGVGG